MTADRWVAMDDRSRLAVGAAGAAVLFVLVQVGALLLVEPFVDAGYQAVEDPGDPTNSAIYLGAILVMTGFILAIIRFGVEWLLRAVVILVSVLLAWYVFSATVPRVLGPSSGPVAAVLLSVALGVALFVHPEWYVIDAAGVVIGAGGAGLFGVSFGPLPAILLLVALAVYDALAVYRTKHMLTLAESVTGLKLPLVLVVPLSWDYSFRAADPVGEAPAPDDGDRAAEGAPGASPAGARDEPGPAAPGDAGEGGGPALEEREAFFIGLGDTVMPTILVASAAVFLEAPPLLAGSALNLPALAAMAGTLVGLGVLLRQVAKGQPHAGLPLLNGGAIAGYLAGAQAAGVPVVVALGLAPYL